MHQNEDGSYHIKQRLRRRRSHRSVVHPHARPAAAPAPPAPDAHGENGQKGDTESGYEQSVDDTSQYEPISPLGAAQRATSSALNVDPEAGDASTPASRMRSSVELMPRGPEHSGV